MGRVFSSARQRRSFGNPDRSLFSASVIIALVVWWGWMPVCAWLWKQLITGPMAGIGTVYQGFHLFFVEDFFAADAGFWGLGAYGWLWIGIGMIGSLVILLSHVINDDGVSKLEGLTAFVAAVALVASVIAVPGNWVFRERNKAYFYLSNTTLNVEDIKNPPVSLQLVFAQNHTSYYASEEEKEKSRQDHMVYTDNGKTVRIGEQTLVKQADLPADLWEWEPRNSSLAAALKAFNSRVSTSVGVSPMASTATYAYGKADRSKLNKDANANWIAQDEQASRWTIVLDGSGKVRPMSGVAEWRGGQNIPNVCSFDTNPGEPYRFTRAFGGEKMNSLRNVLADEYPDLVYEDTDIAGFCETSPEGKQRPVIVVSVKRIVGYRNLTVTVPAGALVLRGSPSGYPAIEYKKTVKPGDFPIATYPLSTAVDQRVATDWWAGRGNLEDDNLGFGYTPVNIQGTDNNSEFILRSKKDGRLYAVTPLKPKAKSELYVNFMAIPVDEVTNGKLNPLNSYVLKDGNPNVASVQKLDSVAKAAINAASFDPRLQGRIGSNFFGAGNRLEEMTMLSPTKYRFFGVDTNGSTIVYVDVDVAQNNPDPAVIAGIDPNSGQVDQPVTVNVGAQQPQNPTSPTSPGNTGAQPQQPTGLATCAGKPANTASNEELNNCLRAYQEELLRRLRQQPSPTPSPTPSVQR